MSYRSNKCDCFCEYFVWACRFWGILTAIGLWGVGVETAYRKYPLGAYLLVAALLVSLLESVFIVNLFLVVCGSIENKVLLRIWQGILWFDNWKKGIFYILLSVGCFVNPHTIWLALLSGAMLVISGILYCIKTYKARLDQLTDERARNQTYDRFDEVQDDIDENLVEEEDVPDTLADQDEILDV